MTDVYYGSGAIGDIVLSFAIFLEQELAVHSIPVFINCESRVQI